MRESEQHTDDVNQDDVRDVESKRDAAERDLRVSHSARIIAAVVPELAHAPYSGEMLRSDAEAHAAILTDDTSADIEQRQIDSWRRLSPLERLQMVSSATAAVVNLSLAGIRRRHPEADVRKN